MIVETSATHQAISNMDMMSKGSMTELDAPSGNTTQVTLVGNYDLLANSVVTNIFCLPAFQHNLLYVSKITKELGSSVTFFPHFYVFWEL